jgi:N-formylglutamate amidohydrolase
MRHASAPPVFRFTEGTVPLLLSIPHAGTYVPDDLRARLTEAALPLPDTDWHVDRLYEDLVVPGPGTIIATHARYVVDLNRPPDDAPLYRTATTGLCPTTLFDGTPAYAPGAEPDIDEGARRVEAYWRPYHTQLRRALDRLLDRHGVALLFDAHSIRSEVPRLFDGVLSDFNIGTNDGRSAAPELEARVAAACGGASGFTTVVNGRFKGGYITRHYGQPDRGIHAIQLELSQSTYMDEAPPYRYRTDRADRVRRVLREILTSLLEWAENA